MDNEREGQGEYLCWYDGCTNCPALKIPADSPLQAADQYREKNPEHRGKLWVYCRVGGLGPLHWSL
jgi:hypothetical protein